MWERRRKNNSSLSDGCQSSGSECVKKTTQLTLCNSGARKGGFSTAASARTWAEPCAHLQGGAAGQGYAPAAHICAWVHPVVPRSLWPAAPGETWSVLGPPQPSPSAGIMKILVVGIWCFPQVVLLDPAAGWGWGETHFLTHSLTNGKWITLIETSIWQYSRKNRHCNWTRLIAQNTVALEGGLQCPRRIKNACCVAKKKGSTAVWDCNKKTQTQEGNRIF